MYSQLLLVRVTALPTFYHRVSLINVSLCPLLWLLYCTTCFQRLLFIHRVNQTLISSPKCCHLAVLHCTQCTTSFCPPLMIPTAATILSSHVFFLISYGYQRQTHTI